MRWNIFASLLAMVVLSACAHPRPKYHLGVAIPATAIRATNHSSLTVGRPEPSSFTAQAAVTAPVDQPPQCRSAALATEIRPPSRSSDYLILSGGSLNGSFGAGFFLGLQEQGALPPEPRVVTGVSTGSLQATMLFLARQAVPGDRDYRWQGGMATQGGDGLPPLQARRSNIEDLALAYSITRESDILRPVPLGGVGLLLNGTKGDLNPLRRRLLGLISPGTIREVAIEACRGRKLYVGVTDVDDGQAYALDLTALALRAYDGNATPQLMTLVRRAYVESLIASSSVPVGARPVTLRIRDFDLNRHRFNLFVDGGARFGVFLREVNAAHAIDQAAMGPTGSVTLIVNTRLSIKPWHEGDLDNPKEGWLLTTLGLRTVEILENQVYRLSVEAVETKAAGIGTLHMAYISNENIPGGEEPDQHKYRGQTCDEWYEADKKRLHPIQFYPSYMACLIDYGRQRGRSAQWNK